MRGTFVFDGFVITSPDPLIRTVQTSFNVRLTGSLFVFAINPGTEASARVDVRLIASDCSDTLSTFYEACAVDGNLIQVTQKNTLILDATNSTAALSSVFGSGAFAPLNVPGTSFATTFTVPVDVVATSPTFLAPVGRPFSVGVEVFTEIDTAFPRPFNGQSPAFGRGNVDFDDPISFPTTGPVFDLPAGFTVNSPNASVVNNRFVGGPGSDTTPPVTVATLSPRPNAAGWNNGNVTVTLTASDNEPNGTGVKEIHFSLAGAQGGSGVSASTASVPISAEGSTTLTYFGIDNAGNQEAPKALTVRIDKTPPVIAGLPAAGCTLWPPNRSLVTVGTVTATDALSGVAPGSPTVTGTSNEAPLQVGSGQTAADVVITGTTVQLRAERSGTGTGRVYTLTATANDVAGNSAMATAVCRVPHDQSQAASQ